MHVIHPFFQNTCKTPRRRTWCCFGIYLPIVHQCASVDYGVRFSCNFFFFCDYIYLVIFWFFVFLLSKRTVNINFEVAVFLTHKKKNI